MVGVGQWSFGAAWKREEAAETVGTVSAASYAGFCEVAEGGLEPPRPLRTRDFKDRAGVQYFPCETAFCGPSDTNSDTSQSVSIGQEWSLGHALNCCNRDGSATSLWAGATAATPTRSKTTCRFVKAFTSSVSITRSAAKRFGSLPNRIGPTLVSSCRLNTEPIDCSRLRQRPTHRKNISTQCGSPGICGNHPASCRPILSFTQEFWRAIQPPIAGNETLIP